MPVVQRLPTGAGTYQQLTSSSGGARYANVDDPIGTPDDDATYNYDGIIYRVDTFTHGALSLPAGVAIVEVRVVVRCRKTTTGTSVAINSMMYRAGTQGFPTTIPVLADDLSYQTFTMVHATEPTGGAWTEALVDATEFGYQIHDPAGSTVRFTQVYLEVEYAYTNVSSTDDLGVKATESDAIAATVDDAENAAANVTESEAVETIDEKADSENAAANVTEAEAVETIDEKADSENAAANVTEAETVVAHQVVTPATATLATTGFSPAITTTALATPGTLALTLAAYAPAIVTPVTVTPGVLALSLTGYAPALTVAQRLYRNARMAAGAVAGGPRMQGGAARGPARTPGGVVRPT